MSKLDGMKHQQIRAVLRKARPEIPYADIRKMTVPEMVKLIETAEKPKKKTKAKALPEIWTPDELAGYVKLSRSSVFRLLQEGKIPGAQKIGGSWRIRSDLFLASFSS